MASGDRDITLDITANDDASKVLDDVAGKVKEIPDEVTVDVDADTGEALSRVEQIDRQLEGLTGDARELRIRFAASKLEGEIRNALRDLERLDDPVDIEVRTTDLERATTELAELAELAGRKYDVNVDTKKSFDNIVTGADQANSAVANMVGNSSQELGELIGVTGGAGQALGQLAEYFTETGIEARGAGSSIGAVVRQFGKSALPIAAIAAGMLAIAQGAKQAKERTEELTDETEALSSALDEVFAKTVADLLSTMFLRAALDGKDLNDQLKELAETNTVGARRMLDNAEAIGLNAELQMALSRAIADTDAARRQQTETEERYGDAAADAAGDTKDLAAAAREAGTDGADAFTGIVDAAEDADAGIRDVIDRWDLLRRRVDGGRTSFLNIGDAFDEVKASALEALAAADQGLGDADAKARDAERSTIALKDSVIDYAEEVGDIPPEKVTDILALIDEGKLDEAERALDELERERDAVINVQVRWPRGYRPGSNNFPVPDVAGLAGRSARSGVDGDVAALTAGGAPSTAAAPASTAATVIVDPRRLGVTNVNVYLPAAADGRDVVRSIDKWSRVNGR